MLVWLANNSLKKYSRVAVWLIANLELPSSCVGGKEEMVISKVSPKKKKKWYCKCISKCHEGSSNAGIQDQQPHEKVLIHIGADRPRPTAAQRMGEGPILDVDSWDAHDITRRAWKHHHDLGAKADVKNSENPR